MIHGRCLVDRGRIDTDLKIVYSLVTVNRELSFEFVTFIQFFLLRLFVLALHFCKSETVYGDRALFTLPVILLLLVTRTCIVIVEETSVSSAMVIT